ncbi:MAG: T9SS type A sorting domain-containing protein [Ignavibacteria bacterium]|nr:T9SS type A sorting domain-containing protein [Ignavibacteria bacterium]
MKLRILLLITLFFYSPASFAAVIPRPAHIVICIMENRGYNQIIGSAQAPYINSLANDSKGALFTNSHGLTHPSQPNYLMLYSGSNQGVIDDATPSNFPFLTPNLGAFLINAGFKFTGYCEDLPSVGYNGTVQGSYYRKHNPWCNWQTAPANGYPITVNQPFTAYPSNFDSLPAVSFVVPNIINDMHDGTIPQGDAWIQNNLGPYVTWCKTHNSLFILTWDEDNGTTPNQIPTIFVGEKVLHAQYNQYVSHYSILKTIEDMYGLPYAGHSDTAHSITNCWSPASNIINTGTASKYSLSQNYPNPFNPATKIDFEIVKAGNVKLKIYNELGEEKAELVNENLKEGKYEIQWDAKNETSGVYYYTLEENGIRETKSMMLIK